MVGSLGPAVGIPAGKTTMKVSTHKDIKGALILDEILPPQHIPQSKHYAINKLWTIKQIIRR